MEITNYKGKDYLCKTYPDRIILFSLHYVDESFKFCDYDGLYEKIVEFNECANTRYGCVHASYKGEDSIAFEYYLPTNQIHLVYVNSYSYSKEFINIVMNGKEGRELDIKCDFDIFTDFYISINNYATKEKRKIPLERDIAKELLVTSTLCYRKNIYESFKPFLDQYR